MSESKKNRTALSVNDKVDIIASPTIEMEEDSAVVEANSLAVDLPNSFEGIYYTPFFDEGGNHHFSSSSRNCKST